MTVKSKGKNIRGSAQKARIPARVVVGMPVREALAVLKYMPKAAAKSVYKVVHTARADAEHNFNLDASNLYVKSVVVNQGLKYRRIKAGSRGGANFIDKHFCHIEVELEERGKVEKKASKKKDSKKSKEKSNKKKMTESTKVSKAKGDKNSKKASGRAKTTKTKKSKTTKSKTAKSKKSTTGSKKKTKKKVDKT